MAASKKQHKLVDDFFEKDVLKDAMKYKNYFSGWYEG